MNNSQTQHALEKDSCKFLSLITTKHEHERHEESKVIFGKSVLAQVLAYLPHLAREMYPKAPPTSSFPCFSSSIKKICDIIARVLAPSCMSVSGV